MTWANKFVATWNAIDVCVDQAGVSITTPYPAVVSQVSASKINVKNFGGFDIAASVDFDLSAADAITIAGTDNGGRVFAGTGVLGTDGKITYTYKVTYSDGTFENCTGTMSK